MFCSFFFSISLREIQYIHKIVKLEEGPEVPFEINPITNKISISSNAENIPTTTLVSFSGKITLPSEIGVGKKKFPLVKIGEFSFSHSGMTELFLPSSIYAIGKGAFAFCTKLERIDMSQCKINMLNDKLFYGCYSLYDIRLPDSIATIGDLVFFSTSITNFTIRSNLKHLNSGIFANCTSLNSITMDSGNRFFSYDGIHLTAKSKGILLCVLPQIEQTRIPSNIVIIGRYSFAYSQLQSIKIPSQITEIQSDAFSYCQHLTNIEFSQGSLREIGKRAFKGSRIPRIVLPKSLQVIQERALSMSTLRSVDLSNTQMKVIKSFTFDGCSSLVVVALPSCLATIEGNGFYGCTVEKIIYCGDYQFDVEFIKKGAFIVCEKKVGLNEL